MTIRDYSEMGITLQSAMVLESKEGSSRSERNKCIKWGDLLVQTFDWISVPREGLLRLKLLQYNDAPRQAVDIRAKDGGIILGDGSSVSILRTWADSSYEDVLSYRFKCSGELCVSTATEILLRNGNFVVERLTGNSGFWIERSECARIYHASHSEAKPPDFESLVFSVEIK